MSKVENLPVRNVRPARPRQFVGEKGLCCCFAASLGFGTAWLQRQTWFYKPQMIKEIRANIRLGDFDSQIEH